MEWRKLTKVYCVISIFCAVLFFGGLLFADGDPTTNGAGDLAKDMGAAMWLITTLTGVVKTLVPKIPDKLVPMLPLLFGTLYGIFLGGVGGTIEERVAFGISFGLQAMGAYRAAKVFTAKADPKPPTT